ncbi:folylpolyglutamate synthase [Nitzschia inconspicua]|uniref:Folylpolyglutamate synthase n=1 Tax=Nitzschia inconspicua TaxID=303405 RepID=A0A9K3LQA0_9STRA|nr:folylpolyglutamate synthase [Nitzschia inconspicua]
MHHRLLVSYKNWLYSTSALSRGIPVAASTVVVFRSVSSFPVVRSFTTHRNYVADSINKERSKSFNRLFSTSNESEIVASPATNKSTSFSVPTMGTDELTPSSPTNTHSGYEKWVRRLYATNMFHPVKLGLTNMRKLHQLLGNPMDDPDRVVVHIAGTNGKGSVCLKIANALQQQSSNKVGLFCSPHVSSFRERMQVNGEMITEEEVVELLPQIYDLCIQHDIPATFFEITTALAFSFYAKRGANVVVLETGLGGRLDATNVINNPALTVITSIGLEHTRILGDTIELIAREKGGIIKPGRPVLVGPHCPHEVLQQCAKEKGGGPYYVPSLVFGTLQDFAFKDKSDEEEITDYDLENQHIAKASLVLLKQSHPSIMADLTTEMIEAGTSVRPPCRFEQIQSGDTTVILDVAHNPPAMEYLVRKLETTYPDSSFRFVAGMSSDKDLKQCASALLSVVNRDVSRIHLVEAAHPRAARLEAILDAESHLKAGAHYDLNDRSITRQVDNALSLAKENSDILVICGSVFLMAEAREALGFQEPRDSEYIAEMAGAGIRHSQENFGNTIIDDSDDEENK